MIAWLSEMFVPEQEQDLDITLITQALSDAGVRSKWLEEVLGMIQALNMELDRRLLNGNTKDITDLCAKRKAIQDVLEAILSARRVVLGQAPRPNPQYQSVDLDRVTA